MIELLLDGMTLPTLLMPRSVRLRRQALPSSSRAAAHQGSTAEPLGATQAPPRTFLPRVLQRQAVPPTAEEQVYQLFEAARELYIAGDFRAALNAFQRLRLDERLPPEKRYKMFHNIAMASFQLDRFATAATYFELFLAHEPDHARARRLRRESLNRIGATAERNATQGDAAAQLLFRLAVASFQARDYRRAIILFERVRHLARVADPHHPPMWFNIGVANFQLGRYGTALTYFEQYLARGGEQQASARAYVARCSRQLALTATHDDSAAPELNVRILFREGVRAYQAGDYQTALAFFGRGANIEALSLASRTVMYRNLGMTHYRLGHHDEALFYLQTYVRERGQDVPVVNAVLEELLGHEG